jgi:hypothetical protein
VPICAWPGLHRRVGGKAPAAAAGAAPLLRRGAMAVAAGRVALGLTALAWPVVPARPWVGAAADDLAARVFGRALGARDVALGLGALAALQRPADHAGSASAWVAAGAMSDALDVAASAWSWRDLPRTGRWLVAASAGGAALIGGAGAWAVRAAPSDVAAGDPSPPGLAMAPDASESS